MILIIGILLQVIINFYVIEKIICKPNNDFVQIFAPPGTGKTTLAAKIVKDSMRDEEELFSNVEIIGANKFDIKDLGKKEFKDCTLIIDEAGTVAGNRNWRDNLSKDQIEFLKKHRHNNVNIYLFSQAYGDVDNKFRELTTKLIMLEKSRIPFLVNQLAIRKRVDIIGGQIIDFYQWSPTENRKFFIVNKWAYFNTHSPVEGLPKMEIEKYLKTTLV